MGQFPPESEMFFCFVCKLKNLSQRQKTNVKGPDQNTMERFCTSTFSCSIATSTKNKNRRVHKMRLPRENFLQKTTCPVLSTAHFPLLKGAWSARRPSLGKGLRSRDQILFPASLSHCREATLRCSLIATRNRLLNDCFIHLSY